MVSGETKALRDLRPGDRVLVMDAQQKIVEDEIMMMLDSQPKRPGRNSSARWIRMHRLVCASALFYSIETETGHRLSLTGSHFIAVNHQDRFLAANQIKARDIVYVNDQGQIRPVTVRNVTEEYKVGYFTPMTGQGELNGRYHHGIRHELVFLFRYTPCQRRGGIVLFERYQPRSGSLHFSAPSLVVPCGEISRCRPTVCVLARRRHPLDTQCYAAINRQIFTGRIDKTKLVIV